MKKNQLVQVSANAPHHAGKTGYFQFYGEGPSKGCAVLADRESVGDGKSLTLFAIANEHMHIIVVH